MQIIDFKKAMLDKLAECEAWLIGKDEAVAKADEAYAAYLAAKAAVDEYTPANITEVERYRDSLKAELGMKDDEEKEGEPVNEEPQNII